MLKKAFIIGLFILLSVSFNVCAVFFFQDDTLVNSLRVCNTTTCENLGDSNKSTIGGISSAYETGGSRLNPDINGFTFSNIYFIVGAVLLIAFFIIAWRYLGGKK